MPVTVKWNDSSKFKANVLYDLKTSLVFREVLMQECPIGCSKIKVGANIWRASRMLTL